MKNKKLTDELTAMFGENTPHKASLPICILFVDDEPAWLLDDMEVKFQPMTNLRNVFAESNVLKMKLKRPYRHDIAKMFVDMDSHSLKEFPSLKIEKMYPSGNNDMMWEFINCLITSVSSQRMFDEVEWEKTGFKIDIEISSTLISKSLYLPEIDET